LTTGAIGSGAKGSRGTTQDLFAQPRCDGTQERQLSASNSGTPFQELGATLAARHVLSRSQERTFEQGAGRCRGRQLEATRLGGAARRSSSD